MSVGEKPSSANLGVTEEFGQLGEGLGDRKMITHAITNTSIHPFKPTPRRVKLYLLDRNIICLIKDVNAGKIISEEIKIHMVQMLRSIDSRRNMFSIILSITEGKIGKCQTTDEFITVIKRESDVVRKFFRYARTDGQIWLSQIDSMKSLRAAFDETKFNDYLDFVRWVSPRICEPTSRPLRWKKAMQIFEELSARGVPHQHPIVLCCLGVLYGSKIAHGVLKPNKKASKAYNAVSDIMTLSRASQYFAVDAEATALNPEGSEIDFTFLTLDADFGKLYDLIKIGNSSVSHEVDRSISVTTGRLHVRRELFPEISDEDYDNLCNALSGQMWI